MEDKSVDFKPAVEPAIKAPVHVHSAIGINAVKHPSMTFIQVVVGDGTTGYQLDIDKFNPFLNGILVAVRAVVGGVFANQLHVLVVAEHFKGVALVVGVRAG